MGGPGSGRWGWHDKRTTVEECLPLDAARLARDWLLARSAAAGVLTWSNTRTGEQTASAGYRCEVIGDTVVLRLLYAVTRANGDRHDVDEPIVLRTTRLHNGGARWWFACPLVVNGRPCDRRVRKLYLPPGDRYFGCRHCYRLTYESSQESHKYDRLYAQLARETGFDSSLVKRALSPQN
jgi:hypothetical protein